MVFTPIDTVELNTVLKAAAQYLRNFQIEYLTTSLSKVFKLWIQILQ